MSTKKNGSSKKIGSQMFFFVICKSLPKTRVMKRLYFLTLGLIATVGFANTFETNPFEETDPQAPNVTGPDGKKEGKWCIYGKDEPAKNYPAEGKIEEGTYKADRRDGQWIFYYPDGVTPKLKGNFVNGRPNGDYVKYWDNGNVKEEGRYTDKKQTDVFKTYYKDGTIMQEKKFNQDGKEDGVQKIYHPNGQLEFEYVKADGVNKGTATRYYDNGDVKQVITYNEDGSVASTEEKEMVNPPSNSTTTESGGSGGPSGSGGKTKDGKKFDANGYNKVYNDDDELWMDGKFKSGKLWDGKLYKYDSDGILLKIEIWKEGKYHSDGQL